MPSNRPKLQGYIDVEIHKAFTDWKIEQGFEGDSQALAEVLKQFFGFEKPAALGGMSKEDIQELIAEECEIGLREIKEEAVGKLEKLAQGAVVAYSIHWMENLNSRFEQLDKRLKSAENLLGVKDGVPTLFQEPVESPKDCQWKKGDRVRVLCKSNYQGREGTIIKFDERLGWNVAVDRWWEAVGLPESSIDERQRKRRIGNIWCDSEEMELLEEEITANLPGSLNPILEEEPEEESECNPPFEEGDTFLWWDKEVRVERIGRSTLYCHYTAGGDSGNISYVRVPFEEAEKIKLAEHSELPPDESSKLDTRSSQAISRRLQKADSLTQTELAERLNCHKSLVSRKKESPDFEEWTRERDPYAIAWKYDPKSKRYLVVK